MERIKLHIAYDGTNFAGYQVQHNQRTVQLVVERALSKMHRQEIKVYTSGRTDSGVHANDQVLHFNSPMTLDCLSWRNALQTLLPSDVKIMHVEKMDESFDARKSAKEKVYRYQIINQREYDVFKRLYEWHVIKPLSMEKMKSAAKLIEGTHDFTAFSASKSNVKGDKKRTIKSIDIWEEGDGRIIFEVRGNGFLTHMVRIIVGTLVEIGLGKKDETCITKALETLNRQMLGLTAPSHGLCLWKVIY
ncbi:tRNA pseudouridine(38-40) synthase TruA [Alkalibacillus haloalkaliphilus]|uniref:tRNA pseudouridine(38-40) synthase TruA n=1 Tax=Alkalibacillus haloalkaliphilus TaxID=94136 RepID=UPI0029364FFC|nr:tRNA pseudouridine(38-40) synthase TruA [Alkalibacillus haloalkaliphilus]MDV2582638.1 tRNA pseudouridine(38-40) synthase TruA [Alkalibacillus haloalkaliphilus]